MSVQKQAQVIQITNVEIRQSKGVDDLIDGQPREYKYVSYICPEFAKTINPFTGEIMTTIGTVEGSGHVVWKNDNHKIGGKLNVDYPYWTTEVGKNFRLGARVTKEVNDYNIPDGQGGTRTANTATVLVLGNTTDDNWNEVVKIAFKNAGFTIKKPTVQSVSEGLKAAVNSDFEG